MERDRHAAGRLVADHVPRDRRAIVIRPGARVPGDDRGDLSVRADALTDRRTDAGAQHHASAVDPGADPFSSASNGGSDRSSDRGSFCATTGTARRARKDSAVRVAGGARDAVAAPDGIRPEPDAIRPEPDRHRLVDTVADHLRGTRDAGLDGARAG
ncbi:MAG TPA: hypothetical protein VLA76_08905 [Candidatus Angelobacter sp.]|nr:hypothetical protein [Candidatus Angelobacter sp.]